jgi:hypothetical protein
MMIVDSGVVRPRASSRMTGNLASGQTFWNAARSAGSPRSTTFGSNGTPAS